MKKSILKISIIFATVVLMSAMLMVAATATTYTGSCGTNVSYTLDTETGVLEISGTGDMTNYSEEYDEDFGYYSTAPWGLLFANCVKTIKIEDGVTSIGASAFYNCRSLTSVEIPDSVTSIGDSSFEYCSSLTSVEIPDSVTSIGDSAFEFCSSLTSVEIPDSVTSIGWCAFYDCISLTSVVIPDSVTSIGDYAFLCCSSITSVTFLTKDATINSTAFNNCSELETIYLYRNSTADSYFSDSAYTKIYLDEDTAPETDFEYTVNDDGVSVTITKYIGAGGDVVIPSKIAGYDVTSIGYSAFEDCSSITSVEIPDSVTSIGFYAFYSCSSLTSVEIPDSVTSIGWSAFENCSSLTSVVIPDSVTSIGYNAFAYCSSLTSVTFLTKDATIATNTFTSCANLTTIYLYKNSTADSYFSDSEYTKIYLDDIAEIYTITYNANGGTGAPASQLKIHDVSITLSATKPVRTGYTFQGWATTADGGVAYAPGASFALNADTTLYAVWKANTYTVTYNANGGTGAPASQSKTHDVSITLSATKPVRTGYTFQGWATTADGGVAYAPGASFALNADTTLYAVWKANTYTVTYNANGGIGAPMSQTKTHAVTLTLSLAVPTRVGYDFCGWAISLNSDAAYAPGADFDLEGNTDLYAVWKIKTYSVVYNANGGENAPENTAKEHFAKYTVSSVVPTRAGYRFCGWSTSADGEVEYMPGSTYSEDADLVLYAVWELYGDVDGNGKVSSVDAVVLAQYLAGWGVKVNRATADCNGDGMLNALDAIMLAQKLAGWDVTLG